MTAFLDYEKYDCIGFNSGNSRNGDYSTLHTEYGDLHITIPRDRNGEFKQQTVTPYKRSNDTLESFDIRMFQKGVTMSESLIYWRKCMVNIIHLKRFQI